MNAEYVHVERRILTTDVDAEEPSPKKRQKDYEEIETQERQDNTNDKVGNEGCCCVVF